MKNIIGIMIALALALPAHGMNSKRIDTAVNNIGQSFNNTFPQLALTGIPQTAKGVFVFDGSSQDMECYTDWGSAVTHPSSDTGAGQYIPAGSGVILDFKGVSQQIFCRCIGANCTSGTVIVQARLQ